MVAAPVGVSSPPARMYLVFTKGGGLALPGVKDTEDLKSVQPLAVAEYGVACSNVAESRLDLLRLLLSETSPFWLVREAVDR